MKRYLSFHKDFWSLIIEENLGKEKLASFDMKTGKYIKHKETNNEIATTTWLSYKFIPLLKSK